MRRLLEDFQILCNDYEYILGKKGGIVFKKGPYKREEIIQGNMVFDYCKCHNAIKWLKFHIGIRYILLQKYSYFLCMAFGNPKSHV